MTNWRIIMALTAITIAGLATAADENQPYEAKMYETRYGELLPYQIYIPADIKPDQKLPLVLFLHGAGERGDDNTRQRMHGCGELVAYSRKHNEPAIIVAPQCPAKMQWVNAPWSAKSHTTPEYPSYPMRMAIQLVQKLSGELPVDTDRIYVCGLSMGGYGTWDIIHRKPDMFAAAMPICGGGDTAAAPLLAKLPIWVFHGEQDRAVPVQRSRQMVEALKAVGGNVQYTEYPGVGHNSWTATFNNDKVLQWMFAQKRSSK